MEVLFEKIRGSCWVDRGSQHGFFDGRGGGLIEHEKKERKRERVGFENNSTPTCSACRISLTTCLEFIELFYIFTFIVHSLLYTVT